MVDKKVSHASKGALPYLRAARIDHWFKNIFMVVGIILAIAVENAKTGSFDLWQSALAVLLACLMSSANYIINEIVDAQFDKMHPTKRFRPVASGNVAVKKLIVLDIGLIIITFIVSYFFFNEKFFLLMVLFFVVGGLFYNVPPLRTKDIPYIDIMSESVNNPIRLLLGWYAVGNTNGIPVLAIASCWSFGAALMSAKRLAEVRFLGGKSRQYRPTLKYYFGPSLTIQYYFYIGTTVASFAWLSIVYKFHMLYLLPLILIFFAWFTVLTFQKDSIVKEPERLLEKKPFAVYSFCVFTIFCWSLFL